MTGEGVEVSQSGEKRALLERQMGQHGCSRLWGHMGPASGSCLSLRIRMDFRVHVFMAAVPWSVPLHLEGAVFGFGQ